MREVPIVPVCHSGLSPQQLPSPLSEFESVSASDLDGLYKLYDGIASFLGSTLPKAKLEDLADEIKAFEKSYQGQLTEAADREGAPASGVAIRSPKVLCVTSNQFLSLRRDNFDIIRKAFPETATHRREFTSRSVRDALLSERFDIVHVATYVCPTTGDLIFSDVDSDEKACQGADVLTANAFAQLIEAHTKLVVIASCESFELAAKLFPVSDVIATRDRISADMFALWIENFYKALQGKTLSDAFNYAVSASHAPMRLYSTRKLRIQADNPPQLTDAAAS